MVRIVSNKGKVSGSGVSGSTISASLGKSGVVGRMIETDQDTRGRRSDKKWSVGNMLPATTAIINVYQLEDKWKRGGKAEKRRSGRGNPVGEVREVRQEAPRTSTVSGSSRAKPPREESTAVSPAFSDRRYYTGIFKRGDLVPLKSESNSEYIKANAAHKAKMLELRDAAQEKVSNIEREYDEKIQSSTKATEDILKSQRREDPIRALGTTVKRLGIKVDTREGVWDARKAEYKMYNPSLPDQREAIALAMAYADKNGMLNEVPPPVVPVARQLNGLPLSYYIRKKDFPWYNSSQRRKKIKRPMVRRKPVTKGKKRVVVKKHNGGKR